MDGSSRSYGLLLRAYLLPQWRKAFVIAVLLVCGIALELINPQILGRFIDTATSGGALDVLTRLALLLLVFAFATQIIAVAETYLAENLGLIATNNLRADLMRHCLQLDPTFHLAHTPGELIERVDGDVATLGNFFGRFVVQVVGNGLLLIGVLVLLWGIDWRVGLALTGFSLVALAVVNRLRDIGVPYWQGAREANATLFGFIEERLLGTEDIRSSGATAYVQRGLAARSRTLLHKQRRAGLMGTVTGSVTIVLFVCGTVVALSLAAYLYTRGTATIGTAYLIFYYTELLNRPIDQITRQLQDLQRAAAAIVRVGELLTVRSVITDGPGVPLPQSAPTVKFDRVTFSYPQPDETAAPPTVEQQSPTTDHQLPAVLHEISFTLAPGSVLGLLGRTGSGKTTITRLLLRLYDPQNGTICLDGHALHEFKLADLRRVVGLVTQDIQLFHATVRHNLTFFDDTIPDERIMSVLHELGLDEWYATLPEGLDTRLPPGGSSLSAGQAQLLAFARVFLHDPKLVILDEASSRLDPATEQRMEQAVNTLLVGRTAIIIAHRLGTVQRADQIMILERGRIVEAGPRTVLADNSESHFAHLLRTGMEEALA